MVMRIPGILLSERTTVPDNFSSHVWFSSKSIFSHPNQTPGCSERILLI